MSAPAAPRRRVDPEAVLRANLRWEVDREHRLWLRADYEGAWLHLRINPSFPDEPLYSLLVAEDETWEFDDFPSNWERVGALEWPDSGQ